MSCRKKPRGRLCLGKTHRMATQGCGSRGRLGDGAGGRQVGGAEQSTRSPQPEVVPACSPSAWGARTPARGLPVPSGLWGTAPGGEQGGSICGNRGLAAWEALNIAEH